MGISTTSQPRAKRKLDRAQPQEEGRHRSCAAPNGASAECQSNTTGSRPWLKLYRRYAAKTGQSPGGVGVQFAMISGGHIPLRVDSRVKATRLRTSPSTVEKELPST